MSYLWYWPAGGWDWDKWRARQSWLPVRDTPATSAAAPLLPGDATLGDWQIERIRLLAAMNDTLGGLTDRAPERPQWEFLGRAYRRISGEGTPYTLRRLRYALTDDGEWGYALLLTPEDAPGPLPAVIALHQTAVSGKFEAAGLDFATDRSGGNDYGAELAERGFVVLIPDAIAFGERQSGHANARYRSADEFFARQPDGSVMAKMAFDTSRAVDLMQCLPEVDGTRIGCIGHSHGAYGTLFAMLADDRIRAGVISCGLSLLRTDPGVDRWWRRTALIPRLGLSADSLDQVPWDFHALLACVAPRPLFVAAAMDDTIFPNLESLQAGFTEAGKVYALHGTPNELQGDFYPGPHRFTPEARAKAYALLHESL